MAEHASKDSESLWTRRRPLLAAFAPCVLIVIAWSSLFIMLGTMAWLTNRRVLHPSLLYLGTPVAIQIICSAVLVSRAALRTMLGPRRLATIACMLLGVAPLLWTIAYAEYGIRKSSGRYGGPNVLTRWADAGCASLYQFGLHLRYPHRYEGKRFVMWSDSPNADKEQLVAMDAHIKAMEDRIGQQTQRKVYWARGPVWGNEGHYMCGVAIGSKAGTPGMGGDPLTYIDKHEAAHFVMYQFPMGEIPAVLSEGWAQVYSAYPEIALWSAAAWAQQHGQLLSFRELTSDRWYYTHESVVYTQGGPLVDFLIQTYGIDRFIELCRTCKKESFAQDVQHVYGLTLDELDAAFQLNLAGRGSPQEQRLFSWRLAEQVDEVEWKRLVKQYLAGVHHLQSALGESSITVQRRHEFTGFPSVGVTRERIDYYNDGQRRARISTQLDTGYATCDIVTPDLTFRATKDSNVAQWTSAVRYEHDTTLFRDLIEDATYIEIPCFLVSRHFLLKDVMINNIGPSPIDPRRLRVQYQSTTDHNGQPGGSQGWWEFDTETDHLITEVDSESHTAKDGFRRKNHITAEYEVIRGQPVPKSVRSSIDNLNSNTSHSLTYSIDSLRLERPPEHVFAASSYVREAQSSQNYSRRDDQLFLWPVAAAFTLGGVVLSIVTARRFADQENHPCETVA